MVGGEFLQTSHLPETKHRLNPAATDLRGENRSKSVPPEPDRLMGDVDTALVQQVLDVLQRQRVAIIHHRRQADDLGAGLDVAEVARVAYALKTNAARSGHMPVFL